uniref:EF-hand calcium binding domain 4Bb n=1 Tax=Iconisemion striatum TaxID=60296 RepID=A0A1A7XFB5_9TELE
MRRLHRELPLSAEELEDVFDSLDTDHAGYLTLEAFSSRFSQFLHGRRISVTDDPNQSLVTVFKAKEALYQSQWEARLSGMEDEEEEGHFTMLLDSLGASNVFEDPDEVRSLWAKLRRDEPHLLSNFEEFLARVTHQIKEAHQERKEMESALQRKAATHDSEIRHLYEEMEAQIKTEKDRLLLQDSERLQLHKAETELQCHELNNEKQESHVENIKLKTTNDELSRALDDTSQELTLAQEQLAMLKKQKQRADLADVFDDSSKPAKSEDETPPTSTTTTASAPTCQQRPSAKKVSSLANGNVSGAPPKVHEVKTKTRKASAKTTTTKGVTVKTRERSKKVETGRKVEEEEEVLDAPPDGWPLRRVISIEEDHLPHLLQDGTQLLLHQLSEEEDEVDEEDATVAVRAADVPVTPPPRLTPIATDAPSAKKSHLNRVKKTPSSSRGQPVGKETQQGTRERAVFVPDRLFKVVLVGNSSVGKTSLLRSFCEGRFHPSTTATVGIDYSVKTLTLGNMQVAMQLWDTAGQERYRSITKQFFRKADGVVVMYDVTVEESFKAEAAGEGIPIVLLGNKMDMEREREVSFRDAQQLSFENKVMFFEVSAYTGSNVTESLTQLARVLMEQEDKVRDPTVTLSAPPVKKKSCCK